MEDALQTRCYSPRYFAEDGDGEVPTCSNVVKEMGNHVTRPSEHLRDGNGATPEVAAPAVAAASASAFAATATSVHHSSVGGAKYKLMSPAKLPISRSPCTLTIPPGLSPTSFLESPVLLSNIKAEPSPTTGTFSISQLMQGSGETATFSMAANCSSIDAFSGTKSGSFEFQFHSGSNATSRPPGPKSSSGLNLQPNGPLGQVQDERIPQTVASSSLVKCEMPKEFSSLSSVQASSVSASAVVDSDILNQRGNLKTGIRASLSDQKDTLPSVANERSSDDGYNWRKYGQKLVKGSEFPRSYYKCTYPNCEVKKIFERSPEGQITEIVYKGSHDHPKPQPSRRFTPGALMSIQEEKFDKDSSFTGQEDKPNINAQSDNMDPNISPVPSPQQENDEGQGAAASHLQCVNEEMDEDDPFSKRRRLDGTVDVTPVIKPIREPRVVVQTISEVDILDDGYRWRKYGQKVVRGNPNPRSYYKCTNAGCPVRKHVERASHDPKAVITTYEGKHNHDVPTARTNSHEIAVPTTMSGVPLVRSEENDSISLNLGVGISYGENRSNGKLNMFTSEPVQTQVPVTASSRMVVQASPFSACYGAVNDGIALYGSKENLIEGSGFETAPLQPSNQRPQNLGRILLGP